MRGVYGMILVREDRSDGSATFYYYEKVYAMTRLCGVNLALWEGLMIHGINNLRRSNRGG
jgi:hypothetical protein